MITILVDCFEMDQTTLWTIQHLQQWKEFEHSGILRADQSRIWPEFLPAYQWMVRQMQTRLGEPPVGVTYPIWAWYQWSDARRKVPDLRCRAHLGKGEAGVRIEFTKPTDQILLSDFHLWHLPLAYKGYIGDNEADTGQFEEQLHHQLQEAGIVRHDFENYPPESRTKIEQSWVRIFDPNFKDPYWGGDWSGRSIQATLWQVSLDEVVKVTPFTAK
jgi:hypothetical protein